MRKTFEEIAGIIDIEFYTENGYYLSNTEPINFAIEVAKVVRRQTLIEVANNADADYNHYTDEVGSHVIESFVLKESILQLPKESIEL